MSKPKFHPDNFRMDLRDIINIEKELHAYTSRVQRVRALRDLIYDLYRLGYNAAHADINAAMQPKPASPFAMQEIAPGMFAMTLENPEQLFTLLDDIERYQRTGELPFNDNANIIAAMGGKPPYFV